MAAASLPVILVEGSDDQHVITQLLMRHRIVAHAERPGSDQPANAQVVIQQAGSKEQVLDQIRVRLLSPEASIGFVLDADDLRDEQHWNLVRTWESARGHLLSAGIDVPDSPLAAGYVGPVRNLQDRANRILQTGVWIMPDNVQNGTLEDFLRCLIDVDDILWPFAKDQTQVAKVSHAASYLPKDLQKAELSAWLAWHDPPGLPYGVAVSRKRFQDDAVLAQRFVDWAKKLIDFVT